MILVGLLCCELFGVSLRYFMLYIFFSFEPLYVMDFLLRPCVSTLRGAVGGGVAP